MDRLFWDNITHYKTESVHFWGLMNSATKFESSLKGSRFNNSTGLAGPVGWTFGGLATMGSRKLACAVLAVSES